MYECDALTDVKTRMDILRKNEGSSKYFRCGHLSKSCANLTLKSAIIAKAITALRTQLILIRRKLISIKVHLMMKKIYSNCPQSNFQNIDALPGTTLVLYFI